MAINGINRPRSWIRQNSDAPCYLGETGERTDTIVFDPALFANGPAPFELTRGELTITERVSILGPGAEQVTFDAQQNLRIFNILNSAGDVTLDGLTLTGGRTTAGGGGAIRFGSRAR